MDNTIIQQGYFTSTGSNQTITLESGVDWMKVYNQSIAAANQTTAVAAEFYWQRGFAANSQWAYFKSNAANAANLSQYTTAGGFQYVDTSVGRIGSVNSTITAISTATPPVVTNTGTNGLVAGQVVRLLSITGAPQFGGMDFTVGYGTLSTTTFSLDYASTLAIAGTTASWAVVNWDPLYYPTRRFITAITQASQAVITLSVTHGYQVGQAVRIIVPSACGMVQMNNLLGNIVAVDTATGNGHNSITVDIDSSAFTAFAFPAAAAYPFRYAEVVNVGEDSALAIADNVNLLSDAVYNTGYTGMVLKGGAGFPGGANTNVMFWVAGKSFNQ